MRSVFAGIFFVVCFMLSCTKKATPSTSTKTTTTTKTVTTDANTSVSEVKTTTSTAESSMSVAGHTIYDAKCGRCHGLKNPGDYTVPQWADIMEKMAPKARLDSTQKANVLAYVNFHAKS